MMEYVQIIFEGGPRNSPRSTMQMAFMPGWKPDAYESIARSKLAEFDAVCYIPAFNYTHDQYALERQMVTMRMPENELSDVRPENHALWCENDNGHAFSAKDPDKAAIVVRGESKLICGPCLANRFGTKGEITP